MTRWLFILIIAAGAVWHFTGKNSAPEVQDIPQPEALAPVRDATPQAPAETGSREPPDAQCRSMGGNIVSGMGCVVGAPAGNANPHVSPAEMEANCRSSGKRYVQALNACVSS